MIDPDHIDPAVIKHRENKARRALIVGVQVHVPMYERELKRSRGKLIAIHETSDFPYEVDFGDGLPDRFEWYQLEVVAPSPRKE